MYSYANSRCKGIWLHRFALRIATDEVAVEQCEICGKRKAFLIKDGRVNNFEYGSYHMRQFLLPQHNLFKHEYPNK